MHKILVPAFALALVSACTDPPPPTIGDMPIELRNPSAAPVVGNSFECTGTWPRGGTPCAHAWPSKPFTTAYSTDPDVVTLGLILVPIPVDGGGAIVHIDLQFFGAGVERHLHAVTARSISTSGGFVPPTITSDAIGGWIEPVAVGETPDQRNAGRFFLDFGFGTFKGSYDTAAAP